MDSLGGILTKGLLGNLILARFNLHLFSIEIIEEPPAAGGHGGTGALPGWRPHPEEQEELKTITIAIKFKTKEYKNTYQLNEKKLRVTINILDIISRTVNKLISISLKFKKNRD